MKKKKIKIDKDVLLMTMLIAAFLIFGSINYDHIISTIEWIKKVLIKKKEK